MAASRTQRHEAISSGTYTAPIDYFEADFPTASLFTLHHLEPTRFGKWAIRRADGTIADLLHELDDDIVIIPVVLLRLQRRESERADCLEFIRANWHERSGDGGVAQCFCRAAGDPTAPRKPDNREDDCSACCAPASGFHRSSRLLGDFHDFHLRFEEKRVFHPSLTHSTRTTGRRLSKIAHFTFSFRPLESGREPVRESSLLKQEGQNFW